MPSGKKAKLDVHEGILQELHQLVCLVRWAIADGQVDDDIVVHASDSHVGTQEQG